jgi:hypothetical protein
MLSTHLRLGLSNGLFPSGFPTNNLYYPPTYVLVFLVVPFPLVFLPVTYTSSSFPHSCHMPRLLHRLQLDNSNYTWPRVQISQLLLMQFSPPSRHCVPLRSKHTPQHLVLKHPQSMFVLQCQRLPCMT